MLVPFTTRTWIDEAPGTIVANVVVVVPGFGTVVVGDDAGGVLWLAVATFNGARVPDGMSRAPMITATTTTPTPRRKPDGAGYPGASRSTPFPEPPAEPPGLAASSKRSVIGGDAVEL